MKYKIIYADPPWSYRDKAISGKRGVNFKYKTMTDSQILSMDVQSIADDDCFLFLWATTPRIQIALDTIHSWGFRYVNVAFTWIKLNKKKQTPFMGMGNYTRVNVELCLLGVRGNPKRISASVRQLVFSAIRQHSQKPSEVRDRIIELCGDIPRIELFSRDIVDGWDAWGDDINGVSLNI